MRERRYGAKGERACKPNCKFSVSWIIGILISILISIWKFFWKKRREGETRGVCGSACKFSYKSTYKYSYKPTYKYLGFFPKGNGNLWKGKVGGGRRGGFGFSSIFRGLSPRSLTRKSTYNLTCNPTYNPSYCPHTSDVARGGTAVGTFGTAEPWSRNAMAKGKEHKERKDLKGAVKGYERL